MSIDEKLLPSLEIHPFPPITSTTVRGRMIRVASIMCPVCFALDDFYNRKQDKKFEAIYCPGNQPATFEVIEMPLMKKEEHPFPCAGVLEQHFHVHCNCCNVNFFVALPEVP